MGLFSLGQEQPQQPVGEIARTEQSQATPFYSHQSSHELGKLMLDSANFIQRIRLQLLGYIEVSPGEFEKLGEQFMNDKGAGAIATFLDSHAGKEVFLTKITDADVIRITKHIWSIMIGSILKNKREWAIKDDPNAWSMIVAIVVNQAYFALRRGENGTEKSFFADTTENRYMTVQNSAQQFQKKSFLNI